MTIEHMQYYEVSQYGTACKQYPLAKSPMANASPI
jgi:hypothetical protein